MDRIGPGTLLAGRYRLAERVATDGTASSWRGEDVTLERPVAVTVLDAEHARVQATLDAARRVALVDDRRLQRVLGVGVEGGSGYVVLEWVTGQDAAALAGSVSEQEAVRIVTEAAEALRTAASRSLHHGRLAPHHVVRASDGTVRVLGTAVDTAATGAPTPAAAAQPEARDVRDLAAVLYALTTGRWPFGAVGGLTAAPTERGRPVPARQLQPEVSEPLDRLLDATLAGTGADTLAHLVSRLHEARASIGEGTSPPPGTVAATAGAASLGPATPGPADDDTDVIPVVPAAGAAAGTAAVVPPVATPPAPAASADAGVRPAPTGQVRPAGPVRAEGAAPTARAVGATGSARARTARPLPPVVVPEDDGWDLLPVDDDLDPRSDGTWAGAAAGPDQVWTERQPWDDDADEWPDLAAGTGAAPVLPGGARPERRRPAGAGTGILVVLLMGAFVAGGLFWALDRIGGDDAPVAASVPSVTPSAAPAPAPSPAPVPPSVPAEPSVAVSEDVVEVVSPAGVQPLDPQGDGEENDQDATRAIDGDPDSGWTTQRYNSQDFGGLKSGLGLVFDLGEPRELSAVVVDAPGDGGSYEIRTAQAPGFDGSVAVAEGQTGDGAVELVPAEPVTAQFVLVWFTSLPENDGDWRAVVDEVEVQVR